MKLKCKLLAIFLCVILSFSMSSCSNDDDDNPTPTQTALTPAANQKIASKTLVGNWEMTSMNYAGSSSIQSGGVNYTTTFSGKGKDFTYILTFENNPKTYIATGGYKVELKSNFNGSTNVQDVTIWDASSFGTWSLKGDTLSLNDFNTGQNNSTEILRATNNSFSYDYAGIFGQSSNGANYSLNSGQVSFVRIK